MPRLTVVPARGAPDKEGRDFPWLLGQIDGLDFAKYWKCEYRPGGNTSAGLACFEAYKDVLK